MKPSVFHFCSFTTLIASSSPLSLIPPAQSPVPLYLVGHQQEGSHPPSLYELGPAGLCLLKGSFSLSVLGDWNSRQLRQKKANDWYLL